MKPEEKQVGRGNEGRELMSNIHGWMESRWRERRGNTAWIKWMNGSTG